MFYDLQAFLHHGTYFLCILIYVIQKASNFNEVILGCELIDLGASIRFFQETYCFITCWCDMVRLCGLPRIFFHLFVLFLLFAIVLANQ